MKKISVLFVVFLFFVVAFTVCADYSDNFTSPNFMENGWSSFVYLGNPNGNYFFPERRRLSLHLPAIDTYIYMPNANTEFQNAEVEATFENVYSSHASYGVICHWHDYGWYEFRVWISGLEAGSYAVYKFDDYLKSQHKQPFVILHPGMDRYNSMDIKLGLNSKNTLKMICENDTIRVFINGNEQYPVKGDYIRDSDFPDGQCGTAIQNYSEGTAQIDVTSFNVKEIAAQ